MRERRWIGIRHFESVNHIFYNSKHGKQSRNSLAFIVKKIITRTLLDFVDKLI